MTPDLSWMIGRLIADVEKRDYTWFFRLDDGSVIATELPWRLVSRKQIAVTSEDHGCQFGLPSPVDAGEVVKAETRGKTVDHAQVDRNTGDLTLGLGSVFLTFLCLSSGYEAWGLTHGSLELICTGGGKIVTINDGK